MILRDETPEDAAAVRQVVADAFSQAAEADLVEALRASGDAVISLVAEDDGEIVGDGPTYVSFDVDGLDPVFAPGTGALLYALAFQALE